MIWTPRELSRVRRVYLNAEVDERLWDLHADEIRLESARRLCRELEPLRVDARDVRVEPTKATPNQESRQVVAICAWWEPESGEVIVRGGPMDGEVLRVRDVWDAIHVRVHLPMRWDDIDATRPTSPLLPAMELRATGWSEERRRVVCDWGRVPSGPHR